MRRLGELQPDLVIDIKPAPVEKAKVNVSVEIIVGASIEEPAAVSAAAHATKKKKGKKRGKKNSKVIDHDANEGNLEEVDDQPMTALASGRTYQKLIVQKQTEQEI